MKKKLTDKERMYMIHILLKAKQLIQDERGYFICYAISTAAWELERNTSSPREWELIREMDDRLCNWIADMLGYKCNTLSTWLVYKGHLKRTPTYGSRGKNFRKLQQTRLNWIDWMIATIGEA